MAILNLAVFERETLRFASDEEVTRRRRVARAQSPERVTPAAMGPSVGRQAADMSNEGAEDSDSEDRLPPGETRLSGSVGDTVSDSRPTHLLD